MNTAIFQTTEMIAVRASELREEKDHRHQHERTSLLLLLLLLCVLMSFSALKLHSQCLTNGRSLLAGVLSALKRILTGGAVILFL